MECLTIREVLNRISWDSRYRKEDYEVVFIHRGAQMNRRTAPCRLIRNIQPSWFTYVDEEGNETIIPFHRVLEIRNVKTGEPIWKKREKKASGP